MGYKLMSINPVLSMLGSVTDVSNRNFIRTSLKDAKPIAVENRLFPNLAKHSTTQTDSRATVC